MIVGLIRGIAHIIHLLAVINGDMDAVIVSKNYIIRPALYLIVQLKTTMIKRKRFAEFET